jgi:imidazolonepropionase-like amidohydrolase
VTPTIHTFSRLNLLPPDEAAARDPRLKYLPASARGLAESYVNDYKAQPPSPEAAEARARYYARHLELYRMLRRAGVRFLAGSDAVPFPPSLPAFGLHDELERLVEAGFTPPEALEAATANPARFLGRQASLGTVEPGKLADLVLLDADPHDDIGNTRKIAGVVVGGRYLSKETLTEMLAEVEAAVSKK